ncbi:carbamoyl-phosphate synthase [Favolaschia claudopus]|uniref:Carbamoyl-phosphate synthase n=1 Tax=Favolaschia claudopus TaxID=2862362 RepID=A0AAW0EDX1_9AGAR
MEDRLTSLKRTLEDSLDDLSSPRTSSDTKTRALRSLEKILASAVVPKTPAEELDYFLALQYTFECNVPSRILGWMVAGTARLDALTSQGTIDAAAEDEVATLTSQLTLALSIIQGVCLIHAPTKVYLGRRYALEVILDLFLSSRHLSSTPFAAANNISGSPVKPVLGAPLPLASVILDTLLCILVDSSPALRVFEACHGVHAVVKILKRAGTPREVRMKCLEFLYFYLLDETTSSLPVQQQSPAPAPTAPSTPIQPPPSSKKPFPNATPARPLSRYGSSTFSLTSSSFVSSAFTATSAPSSSSSSSSSSSGSNSRSTSGSSTSSFSSTSSNAGSTSPTKKKTAATPGGPRTAAQPQPRALLMLRKDLDDFVPVSPKGGASKKASGVGRTRSRLVMEDSEDDGGCEDELDGEGEGDGIGEEGEGTDEGRRDGGEGEARTTEEKKRLLATMLGNVEALVEGVRKAGIWGLG